MASFIESINIMNEHKEQLELFMTFEEKNAFFQYHRCRPKLKDKKDEFIKTYKKYKSRPSPKSLIRKYKADFNAGKIFNRKTGKEIGGMSDDYRTAFINKAIYPIHILLFTMYNGRWPKLKMVIDHIDRNKTNNSISNLREVTVKENNNNTNKKENHKYGISIKTLKNGSKKYVVKRSRKHLGNFKTHEEAMLVSLAYDKQLEEEGIKPKAA
jgi:hypothetical protein